VKRLDPSSDGEEHVPGNNAARKAEFCSNSRFY